MKFQSYIKNQKGGMAALLSVIVLSGIVVTTLTSAYMFLENRAKYNGRIKAAYETAYAMEDVARNLRQVYDTTLNSGAIIVDNNGNMVGLDAARCPANSTASSVGEGNARMMLCVPNSMIFAEGFGCTSRSCMCVRNASAASSEETKQGMVTDDRYCMNMPRWADNEKPNTQEMIAQKPPKSKVQKWLARMDKTLDVTISTEVPKVKSSMYAFLGHELRQPTLLGWILPQKAYAQEKEAPVQHETGKGHGGNEPENIVTVPADGREAGDKPQHTPTAPVPTPHVGVPVARCVSQIPQLPGPGGQQFPPSDVSPVCEGCQGIQCVELTLPSVACKGLYAMDSCGQGTVNVKFE